MTSTNGKLTSNVAIIDAETDPFAYGRIPRPFAWGFLWGDLYLDFWGDDATAQLIQYIKTIDTPLVIYAHNGGKFDFYYLLREVENPVRIIHGRIAKAKFAGIHELRDSWLINPQPLSAYKKDEIDYAKFERGEREKHRAEILRYLKGDCVYLRDICLGFIDRFKRKLTMPGAAMSALTAMHPQARGGKTHDSRFRPFYVGGRVECFERGVHRGEWKVYDVNSMYPYVMRESDHPAGLRYVETTCEIRRDGTPKDFPGAKVYFARVRGYSRGAFPVRNKTGGLEYPHQSGEFDTTSHEIRAALDLGLFEPSGPADIKCPMHSQRFTGFVDHFMADKLAAEARGDAIGRLFAKLVLNSGYGKFGQNPEAFREYYFQRLGIDADPDFEQYELYLAHGAYRMWKQRKREDSEDNDKRGYFDVAIAASITGAARATLMRAMHGAYRLAYCDTDSLICEKLSGAALDSKKLGAWKLEAEGDTLAIAGKKLYCLSKKGQLVKAASKGLRLTMAEIHATARGESVTWRKDSPAFNLVGDARFIERRAKNTA